MPSITPPCVATIVARKGSGLLDRSRIAEAFALLPDAAEPTWLAPAEAADIAFTPGDETMSAVKSRLEHWGRSHEIDVFVQPQATRRKGLLLADMDSTLIGQECIDELADFAGLKAHVSAITERAMRGEIAFEPALRERVGLLAGLPVSIVATVLAERITLTPGARMLVQTMRAHGAYCALVSGGFTLFTGPVAERLGFDENRGNVLLIKDGTLTGQVADPILGREAKLHALIELRDRLGLTADATMAVGDGANDLAMLGEAGFGVAFHAKPAVAAAAHGRIDHGDLSALLYAQGYTAADIVS
ncbi:phosphoserine phosphatase SerB [Lichenihabitans sp. PAMC28606]|uniref:phosphoserine phosphatase SerB n=1 Tax=Lichenihabitans sp. PAMC28606 TaxID=2880932 RepID=UPI001D09BA17|nr:phosphoserine phosphatase SerB [Lichenihabitans sp. PAMC28606]UDL96410.1 phosphoserine phosphatase SerB [Lichenihabitans sp. PAMC28606]